MNNNQIYQLYNILQQIYLNKQIVIPTAAGVRLLYNLRQLDTLAGEIEEKRQEIISKYLREGEVQVPTDLVPQVNEELLAYGAEEAPARALHKIRLEDISHLSFALQDLEILYLIIEQGEV